MDVDDLERRTGVPSEIWMALMSPEAMLPTADDLPMKGTRISLSEAARRYDIPQPTINRWALKKYITTIEEPKGPGSPRIVDEYDVAEIVAKYRMAPGQGKRTVRLNAVAL